MCIRDSIYTNEYLETLLPKWNSAIQEPDTFTQLPLQRDFYARNIKNAKERTVAVSYTHLLSSSGCSMRWMRWIINWHSSGQRKMLAAKPKKPSTAALPLMRWRLRCV